MAVEKSGRPAPAGDAGAAAALLVRQALKGALGTLDRHSGHPYASLVTVAVEPDGSPILLISDLALHTKNLDADPRATLMIDGTAADGDPLAGGRVTLIGRCTPTESTTAPYRFVARHPGAEVYASFADFRFFTFTIERAHYVGGFGRIVDLPPSAFLTAIDGAAALVAAEADIVAHMNADHSDAVAVIARAHGGGAADGWVMTGIDPTGFDLRGGVEALRVPFDAPVTSPAAARQALVRTTAAARNGPAGG